MYLRHIIVQLVQQYVSRKYTSSELASGLLCYEVKSLAVYYCMFLESSEPHNLQIDLSS